jgi:phage repressor protein C with HTH and peptisase S24 domain
MLKFYLLGVAMEEINGFRFNVLSEKIHEKHKTNAAFAEALRKKGLEKSEDAIRKWRQGNSVPKVGELMTIAEALDIPVGDLFVMPKSNFERLFSFDKKNKDILGTLPNFTNFELPELPSKLQAAMSDPADENAINIKIISHKASAGTSADIQDIEVFDTDKTITVSQLFFKILQNSENLRTTQVESHSMVPMLYPDTWIVFDISQNKFMGDGLYVLNWRNVLMVKLIQLTNKGTLRIVSRNPDYESWEINPDDQSVFAIYGKVVKVIL